jgi:hypothetical protein
MAGKGQAADPLAAGVTLHPRASLSRVVLGCYAALSGAHAAGNEFSPQVWVNAGFLSYHFHRSADVREDNIGVGAEVLAAPDHALMAGTYINSYRERTYYGAYQWRPLHWQPADIRVSAGVAISALDGYPHIRNGGWFVAPLPLLCVEGRYFGANFTIIPEIPDRVHGAIAVQIKLRVW